MRADAVDLLLAQWQAERPDLDVSAMGVVGRVSRLSRLLERALRENFAERDLQPWEFDVLATLRRAGAPHRLTAGQLTTAMMVTPGAVTARIDALVAKGLVHRGTDPDNRRSVLITLTRQGKQVVDAALAAHVEQEERLLAALTARDRAQLTRLLRKLLLALDDTL